MLPATSIAAVVVSGQVGDSALSPVRPLREVVAAAERNEILRALEATGGVKMHAAKLLGISRAQLYEKLGAFGVASEYPDTKLTV
jgi:DNA-binding NtrC family response regulator